jgi:transcriptional regulator with XRE-family HTH domain
MKQESLARKLRLLRLERGLTLVQAAELTGLTRGTISELELGRREAYMPTLHKIAKGYGINVRELLLDEPSPTEEAEATETEERVLTGPKADAPRGAEQLAREVEAGTEVRRLEIPYMGRPEVREWLASRGHMSNEEFLDWAGDLDPEIDEDGMQGIERGIEELHEKRDELIAALRTKAARKALFPAPQGLSREEVRNWLLKPPGRWELINEIRHEYLARELALVNYSKQLFVEGEAKDYLTYVRDPRSHARMLEERRRVLEEKYAAALAVA